MAGPKDKAKNKKPTRVKYEMYLVLKLKLIAKLKQSQKALNCLPSWKILKKIQFVERGTGGTGGTGYREGQNAFEKAYE